MVFRHRQGLDTVEDAVMHIRRKLAEAQVRRGDATKKKRIVVLGSGWGAHALMKVIDAQQFDVIVISPSNHFAFTPMLPGAAVGTVEYRSMTESVRRSNPLVDYVEGTAIDVDPVKQTVDVNLVDVSMGRTTISYDKLVVACGVKVNDGMVPGAAEFCYRLKECDDAVKLRRAVSSRFETAARLEDDDERKRLLTFVVVGGGPTGVELAGELSDFIRDVTPKVFPRLDPTEPRVILVHSGQELLQQFEAPQRKECLRVMNELNVDVLLGTKVSKVDENHLTLKKGNTTTPSQEVPFGVAIWCAGTAPQPFMETLLKRLPSKAHAGRFVAVDDWLRVPLEGTDIKPGTIFALGDCSRMSKTLPQTAQVAAQQGAYAARYLNRNYDASEPPIANASALPFFEKFWLDDIRRATIAPKFEFVNLGILAYLGAGKALAEVKFMDVPVGAYVGSAGYLLWKSVYIVKQVATRNRVLVTFDWLKAFIFGRDITRL